MKKLAMVAFLAMMTAGFSASAFGGLAREGEQNFFYYFGTPCASPCAAPAPTCAPVNPCRPMCPPPPCPVKCCPPIIGIFG